MSLELSRFLIPFCCCSIFIINIDGDNAGSSAPSKDYGRAQRKPGRKRGKEGENPEKDSDGKNNRRASLRIGTGRKGRGAGEMSRRRGSLKKRDRTAEKQAREDARLERKTVNLPEGAMTVSELAEIIDEKPVGIIKFLMSDLGIMASMTQTLDPATCIAVTEGFGYVVGGWDDDEFEDDER